MKCQSLFSWKNKNVPICLLLKILPSMLSINETWFMPASWPPMEIIQLFACWVKISADSISKYFCIFFAENRI